MKSAQKTVPVIGLDGQLAGYVNRLTTSVGASKVANAPACQRSYRDGQWVWIAKPQKGKV